MLERLRLTGDEVVLDAGCGTGRVTELLLQRLPRGRVVALDASKRMLEEASRNLAGYGRRVEFVEADLGQPLSLSESVDAIFSTATLHWVPDHDRLFQNLASVVRPGGQLVAQYGGAGNLDSVGALLAPRGLGWPAWAFESAQSAAASLAGAGFVEAETWLNPEATKFASREELSAFLSTVVLRTYLDATPEPVRAPLLDEVLDGLGTLELDYVRLNVVARRG